MTRKSHRILIVEDDSDSLINLTDILSDVGHKTEMACDGPTALDKIGNSAEDGSCGFDLVLLDYKMPGMDGVELLEKIRQRNPGIRAIMITAYAGEDGLQRAIAAGTWRVLRKPVDIVALLEMIDGVSTAR
jgi:CheY-like chemotaxis protein